ncbi:MAG: Threonine--tRNA ligase 1 [Elusimicrobia bacterium ADurb.Bin231]|nr:MAG: Threonine--tRNA ligase 1 [Elusimicrobia bacterium ADurb.Bin231]
MANNNSMIDLETLRHSTSHVMAQAVCDLFPGTKIAIGPAIDDGFYYDFDTPQNFVPEDLVKIENRMKEIISGDHKFVRSEIPKKEALEYFQKLNEPYKIELINDLVDGTISFYKHDTFTDLCRGPHLESTGKIKYFKLLSIAGAYWRGSEKNKMLQRIYGTVFNTKEELAEYLKRLEEAKKRDHRTLGKALDLFSIQDEVGPGLVLWHPKGARIRVIVEDYWRSKHLSSGYDLIFTPHIGLGKLWETSGHLDFYKENMYSPMDVDGQDFYVKPMNCPFHIMIYKSRLYSYRDLPLRWAELGTVYRYEKSGVLHGLLRVRGFTQDDAHIICAPEQMPEEIRRVLKFCINTLNAFGFRDFNFYLATKPKEKSVGDDKMWNDAIKALEEAIKAENLLCTVDEGGGAFYGPKIDIKIKDALNREWQCSTIQFDFNEPERFDMTYMDQSGKRVRPYMIHRALLGSLERFLGVLIEHYGGAFPFWLAPVQIKILTITDAQNKYADKVRDALSGYRVEMDLRNEKLGLKIREAQMEKIPYIIVLGDKEVSSGTVAVRTYHSRETVTYNLQDFLSILRQEHSLNNI